MLGGGSSSSQGNGGAFSCSSSSALPPARRHHHHHHQQQTGAAAAAAAAAAAIVSASSCWSPTNPFNVLAASGGGGGSVVVPSTASEEAPAPVNHHLYANQQQQHHSLLLPATVAPSSIQRKRPGCLCDHQDDYQQESNWHPTTASATSGYYNNDDPLSGSGSGVGGINFGDCQVIEPLDLSLPKGAKVRQHWSGGSIVQVNDSTTVISIDRRNLRGSNNSSSAHSGGRGDLCCAGCGDSSSSSIGPNSSRLDVSVVTVQPQQRPSCWSSSSSFANHHQQQMIQQQQQPFRLQIEIPFGASDDKLLPGFFRHHHHHHSHHRRKSSHCNNNNPPQLHPPEVSMTESVGVEEDDLQRLSDSAHQLRLSGYYYGHLSWKESVQLLQNTKVGTFLVRDSSDARYLYALSLQTDKGPTSVRIHYSSSGFRLDASNTGMADHLPRFRTVLDLVDHYVAKWSQCRDKGQFWLDNSGQVHSEVVLIRPLMRDCPSLKHLCRLAWNNHRQNQSIRSKSSSSSANSSSSVKIPPTIKSYLNEYPNQH